MQQGAQKQPLDFEQVWKMFEKLEVQLQRSQEIMENRSADTDKKFQETDKKFQETNRQMKNLMKKMSEAESRWGRFVESLVEGDLLNLLKKKEIKVDILSQRVKARYSGRQYEFDIIARNGDVVVVVEVKTTLGTSDIKEFLEELKVYKKIFPDDARKNIIGAVAFISVEGDSDKMAENKGLYIIKATGDSAKIINKRGFKPVYW